MTTKPADLCSDMSEIRTEIDRIDQNVIALLGERFGYVKAATKFKKNPEQVQAKARLESMLTQRRLWAEEAGLNPELIEKMYRDLVTWFISEEMKHWVEHTATKKL